MKQCPVCHKIVVSDDTLKRADVYHMACLDKVFEKVRAQRLDNLAKLNIIKQGNTK